MIAIWKYQLEVMDSQIVDMPKDAKILTVQVRYGQPCLWVLVDAEQEIEHRVIFTVDTGHEASHIAGWPYVGTYQLRGGVLVFHVFA